MNDCAKCGTQNQEGANFCCRCGSRLLQRDLSETTVTYAPASSDAAAVLSQTDRTLGRVPTLLIRAGGGREGEQILLDNDLLTLGRNPESHLFLDDVTVSRHHARIVHDATGFVVEDLNSLNGTYVNRGRVERQHLIDGDEVQIGKFKFAYLEPSES
ncbi:MAG TPA: FHA domain-containing protein [Thermoleophilia bacterium]|nr:FHA domain-containing protein [Thermoleophilia bacterium]